jgi:dipeptidyl aminopeptidase/acylaminoacyl peptidase
VTLQFGYLPQRRYSEARELAFKSSPVSSIANWRSPVLLVHGDDDRNVPFRGKTARPKRRISPDVTM